MPFLSAAVFAFHLFQITADAAPAAQLPFTLTPPEHIVAITDSNDDADGCYVAWSKSISMNEWPMKMLETRDDAVKALNALGYEALWYTPQIDWSIDTTTDWHYNQYWDTWGYDENHVQHLGEWAYTHLLQDDGLTSAASILGDIKNRTAMK
ncbi:MAG: hypothetical protein IK130_03245 [Oscillospiraceae bacterium]|nr:hypothetical protein [Oscillospiraceae bacterium]